MGTYLFYTPTRPTPLEWNRHRRWVKRQSKKFAAKKAAKQHKKHLRKIKTKKQLRTIKNGCKGVKKCQG